jgi:hypothetical protein
MPTESYYAVQTAIACLKDIGWTRPAIEQRISAWMARGNLDGRWQDFQSKQQDALAGAMIRVFEQEFQQNKGAAVA